MLVGLGLLRCDMIVEIDFLEHWKTRLLVRLLGTESAPLHVIRLWAHCQSRKTDRFTDWKPAVLASVCRWEGDAQVFWDAMLQTFCRMEGGDLVAHDWAEANKSLIAAWENGGKGGRPRKAKPMGYPADNQPVNPDTFSDNQQVNPDANPVNPQVTNGVTDREDREEKIENIELSSLKERIGSWFNRRLSTPWSEKEIKALKAVIKLKTPPEDMDLLERRYRSNDPYLRREIITLLNNWNGEIDKARLDSSRHQVQKHTSTSMSGGLEIPFFATEEEKDRWYVKQAL